MSELAKAIAHLLRQYEGSDDIDHLASQIAGLVRSFDQRMTESDSKHHKLDNDNQVFFYEQDYYVLSNFSAFSLQWCYRRFDTSEAAYHYEKFPDHRGIREAIWHAPSAHEAFKIAENNKHLRRADWDHVKVEIMGKILRSKVNQHEYVRRKLLATGTRELIEDSWRDDFWGWGEKCDGQNMLGKLWMEIRAELLAAAPDREG